MFLQHLVLQKPLSSSDGETSDAVYPKGKSSKSVTSKCAEMRASVIASDLPDLEFLLQSSDLEDQDVDPFSGLIVLLSVCPRVGQVFV